MNNPLKIIHKFKNTNRRSQYIVYIFVGSLVDDNIKDILENIRKKDLFDTLSSLSKNKIEDITKYYGEYWYSLFFNSYHIKDQKSIIEKNSTKKKIIIDKYGKEWFQKHFETEPIKKEYSFAANYYDYLVARNKIKTKVKKKEMDFTTYQQGGYQKGGDDEEVTVENIADKLEDIDENEVKIETTEDLDDNVIEDFNFDELSKLYTRRI